MINGLIKSSKKTKIFNSVIIIGSNKEKEMCDYLESKIKNIRVINLSGLYDITLIYAILKHCKLFIGNDSGLMHLSAAAQIRTLGLFGPSKEVHYRPWGKNSYYLRTKKSYEQLVNVKGYNRHDNGSLMDSLPVDKVLNKCLEIIKRWTFKLFIFQECL